MAEPKHDVSFDDVKIVVYFLDSHAAEHVMPQPAAPRGRGRDDIPYYVFTFKSHTNQVLLTRRKITVFCEIWKSCLPHKHIASPRIDVCAKCETSHKKIMDAVID